jgi:predicted RNase H-like HicB family nuclease
MKYIYPAIFTPENNSYNVTIPDLPGCFTYGNTIVDAIEMARDAVSMWLCDAENKDEIIPSPSNPKNMLCTPDSFINLIDVDTIQYRHARLCELGEKLESKVLSERLEGLERNPETGMSWRDIRRSGR